MIICLTKYMNPGGANFAFPSPWHVFITSKQCPVVTTTLGEDFWISNVLALRKVIVMHYDAEACFPQRARQEFGP